MAERYYSNRQPGKRQPLSEIRNPGNTAAPAAKSRRQQAAGKTCTASPQHLPHNESLDPDGTLHVRESTVSPKTNKRVSLVVDDAGRDSVRNSAISTTSTNASGGGRRKTYIGHWQLGKTIGKGGCSRVRVVRHKTRDQYGAVKIITRTTAESTRAQSLANLIESTKGSMTPSASGYKPIPYGLEREIAVMKLLEHPNIVRLYDVWENRNELYLIMEYVDGGELFHYVDERKGLPEDETIYIFRQIVSALLYCHKLLICHRDLKPENILLNQKDLSVKLIDFGMAALQPEGRLLSTPCGSPHYAAPEVVSGRPYDGTQADVWSCGVILYVMLTGTTPYNYSANGDIRVLFRDITEARFWMPPNLSRQAKDLIERIFVPDPEHRITTDGVWDHPLLHIYDKQFGFEGKAASKEAAIGEIPILTDFKVKIIQDIDREILRNMRTLWHSEPEQCLIQKLLNNEINQEKLFYAALVKHREENLENYTGLDKMEYSNSDYHHAHRPPASAAPPVPPMPQQRTQSQYSIMNDEHLKASHSFVEPPPSISSYDPYRASKDRIVNARGEYVNVTVHRQGSSAHRKSSVGRSFRHQPNMHRIEELKKQSNRRVSNYSLSSLARSPHSRSSMRRSSASRHSLSSSVWPSSPPVVVTMRPSEVHKRGVSFDHLRRTSTTSAISPTSPGTIPPTPSVPESYRESPAQRPANPAPSSSSTSTKAELPLRSRKERIATVQTPRIRVRRPENPAQHMRNDIRKHSAELEKACEEAFFRSSVGSSVTAQSTFSEGNAPFDTPPSSTSRQGSIALERRESKAPSRPLPGLSGDTPNKYLTKTLEETRDKLAAYKSTGDDNAAKFDEVLRLLEHIMPSSQSPQEKRVTSAPETRHRDHSSNLPIITEEAEKRASRDDAKNWRSVTAPVQKDRRAADQTVRMVPPSSPATIAPLNVRKRSNGSDGSGDSHNLLSVKTSHTTLRHKQTLENMRGLSAIDEDTMLNVPPPPTPTEAVIKKRSGRFGLSKKPAEQDKSTLSNTAVESIDQSGRSSKQQRKVLSKQPRPDSSYVTREPPLSAQSSEFPIRKKKSAGGKTGLSRWFGKKKSGDNRTEDEEATEQGSCRPQPSHNQPTNPSLPADATTRPHSPDTRSSAFSPAPSSDDHPSTPGPSRSWFARFFHLRPATRLLCFNIPRGRARQELLLLLREWQRHGVRDLHFARDDNTISARVERGNALQIKPVAFRVELFVVLEHGRKVGMSIARFVQVRGAVSGFRTVMEVVEGVVGGRGWLVEDEEKRKALCEVVRG